MQLSDQEIIEIIKKKKIEKKKKQRVFKRIFLILFIIFVLILGIGIFINRNASLHSRGIIFIDPAHGGMDAGSVVGKRYEKNDTLIIAKEVKKVLENQDFKVYLSRNDDKDVEIADRGKMANDKKAQLFVSIHRNKAEQGTGVEIYIPSSNDKSSRLLGNNIFKAMIKQGFEERTLRAGTLLSSTEDYLENKCSNMPSCLIELGFLQSKKDNKLFDENLEKNAEALANAISDTYTTLYEKDENVE